MKPVQGCGSVVPVSESVNPLQPGFYVQNMILLNLRAEASAASTEGALKRGAIFSARHLLITYKDKL